MMMMPEHDDYIEEEDFIVLILNGMDNDEEEEKHECGCPKEEKIDTTYEGPYSPTQRGRSQYSMPVMEDRIRRVIEHLLR